MKNLINYYYGLIINEFRKKEDNYEFSIKNQKYEFILFEDDINKLNNVYYKVLSSGNYCHEIILNKDSSIITIFNNKPYILFLKKINIDKEIDIDEILNFNIKVYNEDDLELKNKWMMKIDYYEYQMNELSNKYRLLKFSFDYYIGLSECAIELLDYIDFNNIDYYVVHKRIKYRQTVDEYLNPKEFIIDSRVRDICSYFKIYNINEKISDNFVINCLNAINFNKDEAILFLARLIYPSYYFDLYDKIIQDKLSEERIEFYTKKSDSFERFIKSIYTYLKNRYSIPQIEWLESNQYLQHQQLLGFRLL
ncbi:MAG: hypothetical protein Q4E75_02905 [bacterium]|nr:hypothetical protein [bacterium]